MSMERTATGYKSVIKPTPGRVVWFHPPVDGQMALNGSEPCAALITYVWSDTMVNLVAFDHNGVPHSRTSVLCSDDGEAPGNASWWWEWMPYQKGQAAKYEATTEGKDEVLQAMVDSGNRK